MKGITLATTPTTTITSEIIDTYGNQRNNAILSYPAELLSPTAKLIAIYAISRPARKLDGSYWDWVNADCEKQCSCKRDSRRAALRQLQAAGILTVTQGKDASGKFIVRHYQWTIKPYVEGSGNPESDKSTSVDASPEAGLPGTDSPGTEKAAPVNTGTKCIVPKRECTEKEIIKRVPDTNEQIVTAESSPIVPPKKPEKTGNHALTRFSLEEIQKKPYSETRTCPDKATLGGYLYGLSWPRLKKAIQVILNEQTGLPRPTFGYWARAAETWERKYSHSGFPTNVLVNHMIHWVQDESNPKRFDVGAFNLSLPELEKDWRDAQEGKAENVG